MSLPNVNGDNITIDFSESEQTLIYFIAPWCTVCHFSMSNINWLDRFRGDDEAIYVIALSYDKVDEIAAFQAEHELTMPLLLGSPVVQSQFQVDAFPTYYVVDRQGRVRAKDRGYTTFLGLALRF